ncbi:hypothetical protein B0H13DRAFT_1869601 [Mycena leptocephala]|nr:hypothetical protein B0H13DRAFT_1869601 [Mycena leptocephala]
MVAEPKGTRKYLPVFKTQVWRIPLSPWEITIIDHSGDLLASEVLHDKTKNSPIIRKGSKVSIFGGKKELYGLKPAKYGFEPFTSLGIQAETSGLKKVAQNTPAAVKWHPKQGYAVQNVCPIECKQRPNSALK